MALAHIQSLTDLPEEAHLVNYEDGELIWATQGASIEEPTGRLKETAIIYALKLSNGDSKHIIFSLDEAGGDDVSVPFKLSSLVVPTLPQPLGKYIVSETPEYLRPSTKRQLHVIVSTQSGLGKADNFWTDVLQPLLGTLGLVHKASPPPPHPEHAKFQDYSVILTQNSHSVRDFAHGLPTAEAPNHTIILLSGDGGVVDLLNGADESSAANPNNVVAILPLGTGNALFHSLHKPHYLVKDAPVPSSFVLGLRTLFRGVTAPLPTFIASFSPGSRLMSYTDGSGNAPQDGVDVANLQERTTAVSHLLGGIVASYGFHASLVWESDTPEYRKHGAKRFGMAAQELLKLGHSYDVRVQVQGSGSGTSEWTELAPGEPFNYVLATLVSNLEKTFTISPASKPLDGQLRLVYFGDVGSERTMKIMMAAYQEGAHLDMAWGGEDGGPEKKVGYEAVDAVRVTIAEAEARWRKVCIDGTIVDIPKDGWMEVRRAETAQFSVLADSYDA